MDKPKLSVILPNYNGTSDRFASYGGPSMGAVELLDLCGRQGAAKGVEIIGMEGSGGINQENKNEIKAALEHNGLELAAILPVTWGGVYIKGSLGSADPKIRRTAIDHVKRIIDLAAEMDCKYVGQWPGQDGWDYYFEVDYQKQYEWWVTGMQELAEHNPAIKLGLEPKPYEPRAFSFIDTVPKTLLLIRDIDRPNVGVTLDIGHSLFGHENMASAVALAQMQGKRLIHLHMNDNYADMDGDMPFGSVHFLGFVELFYWLKRTGYDGWHSVDIFPYRTNPAETVLESIRWMEAMYALVDRAGMDNLGHLIECGDPMENSRFFRKLIFDR